jgi:hypothetical protein
VTELACLGIRHHGPGSARSVAAALDELRPDAIALELPADTAGVLGLATRPAMRPPVAVLGHVADQPDRAAFFPLAAFSPEWVTLQWAARHGVPVVPVDLPLAHLLAVDDTYTGPGVDPVATLAGAAGYDDPERWWEDLVEHREGGAATFAALGGALADVRAGAPIDPLDQWREAHMRRALRRMAADASAIAVVCGAWHVPALAGTFDRPAGPDNASLRGLPKQKVTVTWVPWSHRRLAVATGYGAGVTSPGWYAHVFAHPGASAVPHWFARVASLLRSEDMPASPDDLIAATRLADALAVLRGRPRAGLHEVAEAASAVLAGGVAGPLRLIAERLVVGEEVGAVPPETPMVPLARDLLARRRAARLSPAATGKVLELDLRTALGRSRSVLLHQLWSLGVPWGRPEESRRSAGTFRETWQLRWEPELEIRLIEASVHGSTVVAAATAALVERLGRVRSLAELTLLAEQALVADLPGAVRPVVDQLAARAAEDRDVRHLMDALGPLARVLRYGDARATDTAVLGEVVDGLVTRICTGLTLVATGLDDDEAAATAARLSATGAALALLGHPAREQAWPEALARVALAPATHPLVRGRVVRVLFDGDVWGSDRAELLLAQALSPGTPHAAGAAFVEGLLAGAGTILLHDDALLDLVDTWLATLPGEAFAEVVPLLRRTFATFEAGERRRLGELVAGRGDGRLPAPFGWNLDASRVAAAVATVRVLLGVGERS